MVTFYNGATANIPLPPDGAGVKETFGLNGEAIYKCEGNEVTVRFPKLTIGLQRAFEGDAQPSTGVNFTGV